MRTFRAEPESVLAHDECPASTLAAEGMLTLPLLERVWPKIIGEGELMSGPKNLVTSEWVGLAFASERETLC
jgi:hypothetical protein